MLTKRPSSVLALAGFSGWSGSGCALWGSVTCPKQMRVKRPPARVLCVGMRVGGASPGQRKSSGWRQSGGCAHGCSLRLRRGGGGPTPNCFPATAMRGPKCGGSLGSAAAAAADHAFEGRVCGDASVSVMSSLSCAFGRWPDWVGLLQKLKQLEENGWGGQCRTATTSPGFARPTRRPIHDAVASAWL
jgi:hypothetical protein